MLNPMIKPLRQPFHQNARLKLVGFLMAVCFLGGVASPASAADQRGRPHLNAARTSFVADNGQLLRGASAGTEYGGAPSVSDIQYSASRVCNAIRLYAENFVSGYAPGSVLNHVDQVVAMTWTNGMYLVMTITNSWANGSNSLNFATNFWSFYTPRYANETHVICEIHNEPVAWGAPYSSSGANPPGALNMEAACCRIIRAKAPNSHVLPFTYSVLGGSGGASTALPDIHAFNTDGEPFMTIASGVTAANCSDSSLAGGAVCFYTASAIVSVSATLDSKQTSAVTFSSSHGALIWRWGNGRSSIRPHRRSSAANGRSPCLGRSPVAAHSTGQRDKSLSEHSHSKPRFGRSNTLT